MFKSTKEFNEAILCILECLRNGFATIDDLQSRSGLDNDDFGDAVKRAIDTGLIDGLYYHEGIGGIGGWSVDRPRLSYIGMQLIENSDRP